MLTLHTVSDLHLFCRRSEAPRHERRLTEAIAASDIFVFNGDTVDFRWTTLANFEATADAAIDWLRRLANDSPHCAFHVLLGNHDHVDCFIERLTGAAASTPNLEWHPYYARFGDTVFLHGDAANRRMTAADLAVARRQKPHRNRRGELPNRIWDAAFKAGVHKGVTRALFPRHVVAGRLHHYLDNIGHGAGAGVTDVYFGHTHRALNGFVYNGLRFHNGGAPMPGVDFRILRTTVDDPQPDSAALIS